MNACCFPTVQGSDNRLGVESWLLEHCKVHLKDEIMTVFHEIKELQRWISTLAFNQVSLPTTTWSPDMMTLQHREFQLRLQSLLDGIKLMVKSLRTKLHGLSNGKPIECKFPEEVADDLTSTDRGLSWI
jgi:hypothetical protein